MRRRAAGIEAPSPQGWGTGGLRRHGPHLACAPERDTSFRGWPLLNRCAQRLLSMHVSSASTERNWSLWGQIYTRLTNRLDLETAEKKVFIRENSNRRVNKADDDMEVALGIL